MPLPGIFNSLEPFRKLLIVRCIRPDKVSHAGTMSHEEGSLGGEPEGGNPLPHTTTTCCSLSLLYSMCDADPPPPYPSPLPQVVPAVQDFVQLNLGTKYVEPPPFNLHACYGDSTPITPLIFVLSAGSDPTAALLQVGRAWLAVGCWLVAWLLFVWLVGCLTCWLLVWLLGWPSCCR